MAGRSARKKALRQENAFHSAMASGYLKARNVSSKTMKRIAAIETEARFRGVPLKTIQKLQQKMGLEVHNLFVTPNKAYTKALLQLIKLVEEKKKSNQKQN